MNTVACTLQSSVDLTLLQKYPHAFLFTGAPRRIHGTEHHITLVTHNYKPLYRMRPSEGQAVRDQINAMLKQDIIRPSKSPWGAPAILVRIKDTANPSLLA